MGRASAVQAKRNRDRVVEVTSLLIRAQSFDTITIKNIMSAASLTPGAFCNMFDSKEALLNEALQRSFKKSVDSWDALGNTSLQTLISYYFMTKPEETCPMLAFPSQGTPSEYSLIRKSYSNGCDQLLQKFLGKKARPEAEMNSVQLDPKELTLFAAMVGAAALARGAGETPWIKQLMSAVIDLAGTDSGSHIPPVKSQAKD